jgi:hypothetical protein
MYSIRFVYNTLLLALDTLALMCSSLTVAPGNHSSTAYSKHAFRHRYIQPNKHDSKGGRTNESLAKEQ